MTAEEPVTVIRCKSPLAHISRAEGAYRVCASKHIALFGGTFEIAALFGEGFHPSPTPHLTRGLHPLDSVALGATR